MQSARVRPFLLSPSQVLSERCKLQDEGTMYNLRRCAPRARMAAGALVDAAVQWLGQVALAILFFLQFDTFCSIFAHLTTWNVCLSITRTYSIDMEYPVFQVTIRNALQ